MTDQTSQQTPVAKMLAMGVGIGLGAILLFGAIWIGLGQLGVADATRVVSAVCAPPAVLTVIVMWVVIVRRPLDR